MLNLINPVKADSLEEFEALEDEVESTGYTKVGEYNTLDTLLEAAKDHTGKELDSNQYKDTYTLWIR